MWSKGRALGKWAANSPLLAVVYAFVGIACLAYWWFGGVEADRGFLDQRFFIGNAFLMLGLSQALMKRWTIAGLAVVLIGFFLVVLSVVLAFFGPLFGPMGVLLAGLSFVVLLALLAWSNPIKIPGPFGDFLYGALIFVGWVVFVVYKY